MRWVVIVNGPPGRGSPRWLLSWLSLGVPMLSRDTVEEFLLDHFAFADRDASRWIGAASGELLWTLLTDFPTPR